MFYKDNVSGELVPFFNLQMYLWSAPSHIYMNFISASLRDSVLYWTGHITASLNISAFIGIVELSSVSC